MFGRLFCITRKVGGGNCCNQAFTPTTAVAFPAGVLSVMGIFRQQPFMLFTPSADYNVSRQVRDNLNLAHGGVMKRLYRIVTITAPLIVLVLQSAGAADTPSKQIAARTELYQIQTLTLSDQQFLKGDTGGKPVTITGQLRIAQGSGRLPVVVLQHGSGGYAANIDVWSRELNELGISTFALDNFTGRGLAEVNTNQALLGRLNFILDDYRALEVLASHPRVDPKRIVLMGFSRGGQAALYASLKRFNRLWNKSGVEFAAYVPFYPDCMTTYISDT